jgi:hypothetical protein
MDYRKIYDSLMNTRLELKEQRIKEKRSGSYFEGHHIIPKSKGGTGISTRPKNNLNIVLLTAREHFLAHWLLWRIYRDRSSALAFHKMMSNTKLQNRVQNSRGYEEARLAFRETNKGNQYGKGVKKVISEEQRKRHSEFMKGRYIGENNPFYNKTHSKDAIDKMKNAAKNRGDEWKQNQRDARKNLPKIECEYCKKLIDPLNYKRWHGDNCKLK